MSIRQVIEATLKGMNHDFCPQLNGYVYWVKQPVGWVVGGAFSSLLVGIFIGPQGFVLMWSLLALLLLGVLWPWLSMKGLSCQLHFVQSRTHEGHPCKVILEVTNSWPLPAFGLMLEGNFLQTLNLEEDTVAVGLRRVPGWSVSRFEWPLTPDRRGILPNEMPTLSNGYPFGLYKANKSVELKGTTIVWPASQDLDGTPELGGLQFNIDGLPSDRTGNDGETIGVRDYRHGDAIKNIQWTHTARCNRLIVRERQTMSQMPIRVIVDLTAENHQGEGTHGTFEHSIRIVASVCRKLQVHQSRIELICLGLPDSFPSKACNRKGLNGLLDFLALLPRKSEIVGAATKTSSKPHTIRAENQFVILIHTTSFQGAVKSSNLLRKICVENNDNHLLQLEELFNSTSGIRQRSKSRHVNPVGNMIPTQRWQGVERATG